MNTPSEHTGTGQQTADQKEPAPAAKSATTNWPTDTITKMALPKTATPGMATKKTSSLTISPVPAVR